MLRSDSSTLGRRIFFVSAFFFMIAGIITAKLVDLQIFNHTNVEETIVDKLTRTQLSLSKRGQITTRDNVVLAKDKTSYQLNIVVEKLDFGYYENTNRNLGIIQELEYTLYPRKRKYRKLYRGGLVPTDAEDLKVKIKNLDQRLRQQELLIRLSELIDVPINKLVRGVKKALLSCLKKENYLNSTQWLDIFLEEEEAYRLLRNRELFFGFSCAPKSVRHYPQKELASHLVGYMGKISSEEYKIIRIKGQYRKRGHQEPLIRLNKVESETLPKVMVYDVGIEGTESIFNQALRGKLRRSRHFITMDNKKHVFEDSDAKDGYNVQLSIDSRLQALAEKSLGHQKGAVVLIDMDTGDLLICASTPSYDPNLISIPRKVDYNDYIVKQPGILMSKPLKYPYPFGSVFKIITATAALEEGISTPSSHIHCGRVKQLGRSRFHCLSLHSDINVVDALKRSCNIYFYEVGLMLKIKRLHDWSAKFHLGQAFNTGFPFEQKGVNPSFKYKYKLTRTNWYPGDTCHVSIGQGFQTGTPLQAAFVAALISRPEGTRMPRLWTHKKTENKTLDIASSTREAIRAGLHKVVNDYRGTAYKTSKSDLIVFAGKTGTADISNYKQGHPKYKVPHAWFAGFAPYDNPKVAIAVIVENGGHGGDTAAPIAKKVFEEWAVLFGGYERPAEPEPSESRFRDL